MNRRDGQHRLHLAQHAGQAVDWRPWDAAALTMARTHNKPILLSIGYCACHWCTFMARESFADPATAALMNELFVNIIVDHDQRPDLDRVYQLAHQLLTRRRGGWLLTMFDYTVPPPRVLLRCAAHTDRSQWRAEARAALSIRQRCYVIEDDTGALPGVLEQRTASEFGAVTAWLYSGHRCSAAIKDLETFAATLSAAHRAPP